MQKQALRIEEEAKHLENKMSVIIESYDQSKLLEACKALKSLTGKTMQEVRELLKESLPNTVKEVNVSEDLRQNLESAGITFRVE